MEIDDTVQYDEGSLSSDIAEAWETLENEAPETVEEETPHGDTTAEIPPGDASAGEPVSPDPGGEQQPAADDRAVAGGETPPEADTPPVSLPAAAREVWKDTPPAMRAAIAKREADFAKGIEKYRTNAERATQMDRVLSQHQHYFAMTNEPAGKTISDLLSVASNLYMGPPHVKAQIVAGLINQYGVPIETLDSLLAGQPVAQAPANDIDMRIQQAIQPFQELLQQQQMRQQREQQQSAQQVQTELQTFASSHEFYNDVAMDMADFLDVAAKNGVKMTLEDAYKRACALNPEISQILTARSRAPTPAQKRAASTLRGMSPGGVTGAQEPDSLHAALEAAWDAQGRM